MSKRREKPTEARRRDCTACLSRGHEYIREEEEEILEGIKENLSLNEEEVSGNEEI